MSKTNLLPPEALAEQAVFRDRIRAINQEYKEKTGTAVYMRQSPFLCLVIDLPAG